MDILTVKDANNGFLVGLASGETVSVPKAEGNRHYQMVQDYIAGGGVIAPPDPWEPTLAQAQARRIREVEAEGPELLRKFDSRKVHAEAIRAQYKIELRSHTTSNVTAINALATIEAVRDYKPVWPTEPTY